MTLPTEDEIRGVAAELGIVDEHGNYPRAQRNRLARVVQLVKQQATEAADPQTGTTAQVLARFAGELRDAGLSTPEATSAVLAEAARWLLDSRGLQLETREETTPS